MIHRKLKKQARTMATALQTLPCTECKAAPSFVMFPLPGLICPNKNCVNHAGPLMDVSNDQFGPGPIYYVDMMGVFSELHAAYLHLVGAWKSDPRGKEDLYLPCPRFVATHLRVVASRGQQINLTGDTGWPYSTPPLLVRQRLCEAWNTRALITTTTRKPEYRRIEYRGRKYPSPTG